jgi:hypothetical protein
MAAVLRGTKLPAWSCNCGQGGNWASRIKCRAEGCGKAAPSRIIGRAKAADAAAAKSEGKPDGPGRRQPERAGESSKEAKELKELRKEVAALKKAAKEPDVPEANGAEDSGPNLASLLAVRAANAKELKEGDPILDLLDERIAKARLARDSGKSISTRMADTEKLVARKKKLNEAAMQELQEHLDATAALRQDVDETAAAVVQAEAQLRGLHNEALLAPGQSETLPGTMAGLESMAAGNTAAEALIAELRKCLAAQPAGEGSAGLGTAALVAEPIDDEDDAIMGQLDDFEAAADELAAQCSTSTGGTTEAKKKLVVALAAIKASNKKKKKGGLVVQQQSK